MQLKTDKSLAERFISADDSVGLLDRVVEEMDLTLSFFKTAPVASFMYMKEDHTRNAQLKPENNV